MPVHQSQPYYADLFVRRPSMLRRFGEAIISWADRREAARAEQASRARGSPQELPAYLRRDVGLLPLPERTQYPHRW